MSLAGPNDDQLKVLFLLLRYVSRELFSVFHHSVFLLLLLLLLLFFVVFLLDVVELVPCECLGLGPMTIN